MAKELAKTQKVQEMTSETMLLVMAGGDCSRLTPEQKMAYYNMRCEAAGLDPRAQPFEFMKLQGKEVLYAKAAAASQLASNNGIVCSILSQETESGIRVATVRAVAKDGRQTDDIGAVPVENLKAEALCNAMMKAVTKAKRRATLSLCGLGMMDETELDTVVGAQVATTSPVVEVSPPKNTPAKAAPPPKSEVNLATKTKLMWEDLKKKFGAEEAKKAWGAAAARCADGRPSKDWTDQEVTAVEQFISLWHPGHPTTIPEVDRNARIAKIREEAKEQHGENFMDAWADACRECAGGKPSTQWTEKEILAVTEYLHNWKKLEVIDNGGPPPDDGYPEPGSEG